MGLSTRSTLSLVLALGTFAPVVSSSCIPDAPSNLLADPAILQHPAVTAAFEEVERTLSSLFTGSTRDGFSFAIIHASSPEKAYAFNHGVLKMNETSANDTSIVAQVDSDSIFRVASISKNIAALSALVVENESRAHAAFPPLTLDTPVRHALPEFGLPEKDWQNGGSEITLSMLATHSSGIPREGYVTDFNMVRGLAKADAETIGAEWAGVSPSQVIESVKQRNLMFAPGQRAAYSNAGSCILAYAAANYHNQLAGTNQTWTEYATSSILDHLNMTHSFFGAIPDALIPNIGVPGGPNWVDLVIGPGYDPAGGMWSSANDLSTYLHRIWLAPTPALITPTQRRTSLQPRLALPDGKQLVGFGWEIIAATDGATNKTYAIYGKSGDAGGSHAWLDAVPNLGYGIVALSQESQAADGGDYARVVPTAVRDAVHAVLLPAFAEALGGSLRGRYAGRYAGARDGGAIADEVGGGVGGANASRAESFARLEVEESGALFVRELVVNGTSAWEGLDALGWTAESKARYFSTPRGVSLHPAEGAGEAAQFGGGGVAQVWRVIPESETCDWFDFDGYTDQSGWPLSKIVTVETERGVELHYPPYDIVLTRQ
ncbi:penicillin-binding protein [Diplodia corticola]|uniref:Penicillin-binding protein n=1 Tax=Diplodia corticola TaxID=236234 RepID=A0A1J9RLC4_9PEZI|nr:penicillin-binding protein [Diplodia corticola]OJD29311.1 penicillin-binding protein [Diplodia corticola]